MTDMSSFPAHTDPDLGVTLILDPATRMAELIAALEALGLTHEAEQAGTHACSFSYRGARPYITYSHNPVVDLHVLDVGTAPPALRDRIRNAVGILTREEVMMALTADTDKARLRAIWAAIETERLDLIDPLEALAQAGRGVVADEAARAAARLRDVDAARHDVLGGVRMVAVAATELAGELQRLPVLHNLLLRPDDVADLFCDDVAAQVAAHLANNPWPDAAALEGAPQDDSAVTAAPAGLLRFDNMLSRPFPRGYRAAAGWLKPDKIWVTWQACTAQGSTIRYDGLVFTGTRWLFCPRPFRLVEAVVGARG